MVLDKSSVFCSVNNVFFSVFISKSTTVPKGECYHLVPGKLQRFEFKLPLGFVRRVVLLSTPCFFGEIGKVNYFNTPRPPNHTHRRPLQGMRRACPAFISKHLCNLFFSLTVLFVAIETCVQCLVMSPLPPSSVWRF